MLPPDGLLDRARSILKLSVSEESVQDVKQVSRQLAESHNAESLYGEYMKYEEEVRLAIIRAGYLVTASPGADLGFDLIVRDVNDRMIYVEIKYAKIAGAPLPGSIVLRILQLASRTRIPVLLVTNRSLRKSSIAAIGESDRVGLVSFHNEGDSVALGEKLREIFAQFS